MSAPCKQITTSQLRPHFHDGMSIMFGGFMGIGTPDGLVQALLDAGVKDLTLIGNDTALVNTGVGVLVANHRVKKVIASHIGTNAETGRQMIAGELEVDLVPQGTLAERIRCGGAGLGAVLTQTGLGTLVAEGKTKVSLDGTDYLVEPALHADLAIIKAHRADDRGNLVYERAARNFNPLAAMAADYVIAEVDELVAAGTLDPELVVTPGIHVDALVLAKADGSPRGGTASPQSARCVPPHPRAVSGPSPDLAPGMDAKNLIAWRVAQEMRDGDVVNLGIGLPTLVPNHLPAGITITLQSENGFLGLGPLTGEPLPGLVNAGGQPCGMIPGGAFFDSALSFAIIRGGHVDVTVLGGLQVDQEGNLANWMVPGKMVPGMGGAMDLVSGARTVIVAMEHNTRDGGPKLLKRCSLPLTAAGKVTAIVTELAMFRFLDGVLTLTETAPGVTVETIRARTEAAFAVSPGCMEMAGLAAGVQHG